MKLSYIKEIKDLAANWYGVLLTQQQARKLIVEHDCLFHELKQWNGALDTCGREGMIDCLVETVMEDFPPPENKDVFTSQWHWPLGGSTKEYVLEFQEKFPLACKIKNIKLDENWSVIRSNND